ncbi:flavin-containing monooxygenase [Gordonia terrae]|uniref:flavin-containing monooxygenase n=1 Tax=Gordonia terrae TaxID=2055 RepID=UPI003F6C6F01
MPAETVPVRLDALVVGAGISGLHQLWTLRDKGFDARVVEAGSGVGGTWFWNRYPGARFDSESYSYGYFFSEEITAEWTWSEEYAGQPEIEEYLNFVVDRLDLRHHIDFDSRVVSAVWLDDLGEWEVTTDGDTTYRTRYLITALGILSKPAFPKVPGLENFSGESYHTGLWPHDEVDFTGKRVAVIGTGSSGVQIIPIIARTAASVTVFQRTPNWCTPINNHPITPERAAELRSRVDEIYSLTQTTPAGGIHAPMTSSSLEMTDEERRKIWDELYDAPGMAFVLGNFRDVALSREANANLTSYLADRIRARVDDPAVADLLIPTDHGFGQKRPPLENGYYETYNEPHVSLISTSAEPLESYTETGIRTSRAEYDFDMIIIATGFEAVTGSYRQIDIRGLGDVPLADYWVNGPQTYLGLQGAGFPNLFFLGGPQSASGIIPRVTETQADWIADCLAHMRDHGLTRIETNQEAVDEWNDHVIEGIRGTLQEDAESWAFESTGTGRRAYLLYANGQPTYREKIRESAAAGYKGFEMS